MEDPEREDLDALLQSAGWQWFLRYVAREWGADDGGGAMYHGAVTAAAKEDDDPRALAKLRQIVVAQREIQKLIRWPSQRLAEVTKIAADPVGAGQSRRGGL